MVKGNKMDKIKKGEFVRKMGKKRLKLSKREHFGGGGIAGLLGAGGGAGGTGFEVPSGTDAAQINNSYNRNQTALDAQGNLVNTLAPQAANAVGAQNVLAGQYANQALGQGPNVAQNALAQSTGANVANQAALMAGQRGAAANPALMARQAAMQGAQTQQQAGGQAATLQAEQQIAAEQAGAQLAGNQIAQTQGANISNIQANQGEQGILQGANTANNNIMGNLANTTMKGQQGLLGGIMNAGGGALGLAEGGEVSEHHNKKLEFVHKMTKMGLEHHVKGYAEGGNVNSSDDSLATTASNFFGKMVGPPPASASEPTQEQKNEQVRAQNAKNIGRSEGGVINGYAAGGLTVPNVQINQPQQNPFISQPQVEGGFTASQDEVKPMFVSSKEEKDPTQFKDLLAKKQGMPVMAGEAMQNMQMAYSGGEMHRFQGPHKSHVANYLMSKGGPVPAMVSAGEVYLSPEKVEKVIQGDVDPAKIGHKFAGKAKVKGDSRKNDTIPATLEEGGVVIDRKNMGSAEKRKLFVHKAIARKKAGTR